MINNPEQFEEIYKQQFLEQYKENKEIFLEIKAATYTRMIRHNNINERIIGFIGNFLDKTLMLEEIIIGEKENKFEYRKYLQSYTRENKTIAYTQVIDIINPYESKFKAHEFMHLNKEEVINKTIDYGLITKKYEADKIRSRGTFIEEVIADQKFILDIFEDKKHCERLLPQYKEQ